MSPFPERIRRREIENALECEICREQVNEETYLEVHSVTSLHLVMNKDAKNPRYIVTDPPVGHEYLKGKDVNPDVYKEGRERGSDAVCLCLTCHQEIHRFALKLSKKVGFKGKNPPPQILEEVTRYFINKGQQIMERKKLRAKEKIIKKSYKVETIQKEVTIQKTQKSNYLPE